MLPPFPLPPIPSKKICSTYVAVAPVLQEGEGGSVRLTSRAGSCGETKLAMLRMAGGLSPFVFLPDGKESARAANIAPQAGEECLRCQGRARGIVLDRFVVLHHERVPLKAPTPSLPFFPADEP